MRIGLYAGIDNGPVHDLSIPYIAVDNGLTYLVNQNIKPIYAIGDFDSLEDIKLLDFVTYDQYSKEKDDTDTALAVKYCIEHGYDEIDIYGVIGGRIDHFMAVVALIEKYQNYTITVYDTLNKMSVLLPGVHEVDTKTYHYFSIFAFEEVELTLKNCDYPLEHYLLKRNDPLCVSNQAKKSVIIENNEPILFIQSN